MFQWYYLFIDNDEQIYHYADDNILVCSGYRRLLHNANNVTSWFEANHIKLKPDKFQYMVVGKCDYVDNLSIRENVIICVNNVKIWGLHLDSKLNFNEHLSKHWSKAPK